VYNDAKSDSQLTEVLEQLLPLLHPQSILIINNINSSKEIEAQWLQLRTHSAVTLTINLFQIGLVFFRPENKIAQHFTIRF
jgi:predicted O-methyltransferase YrrM